MKTAINTRTQEEYDALMEWRKRQGQNYLGYGVWPTYRENTCVDFHKPFPGFCDIEWYMKNGYTIIPYTEFAKANITESPNYEERYKEAVSVIKQLSFAGQITGGTAGRDENLVKAIDRANQFLTNHKDGE